MIKKNIAANYFGQFYQIIVGVLIVPFFLNYLGDEAYGLIAFFALMQSWFALLDLGFSPTLSREVAKFFNLSSNKRTNFRKMMSSLECIFLILTIVITSIVFFSGEWLALNWVNSNELDQETIWLCISLMGFIAGFRFFSTLYRSGIVGTERQVWLNSINMVFLTLKNIGALLLFEFFEASILLFFQYQLVLVFLEFLLLARKFYKLMLISRFRLRFSYSSLKPIIPFALGIALTSGVWIALTQLDKLILSKVLSLSEYGYFALVALVSNSILQITGPVSKALMPRMTALLIQGKEEEMLSLYRRATQFVAVILFSVACVVCLYPYELLFAWTGNHEASLWANDILFWYILGNIVLGLNSFQYYLQFAHGKLALHVRYNTFLFILASPLIIFVAYSYGALGVAILWFVIRLMSFLFWTPYVHKKFAPKLHKEWFLRDIFPIFLSTTVIIFILNLIEVDFSLERLFIATKLFSIGIIVLSVNTFVSKNTRELAFKFLRKIKAV
jgi:O-antigen/teichoic acid export membrane protein